LILFFCRLPIGERRELPRELLGSVLAERTIARAPSERDLVRTDRLRNREEEDVLGIPPRPDGGLGNPLEDGLATLDEKAPVVLTVFTHHQRASIRVHVPSLPPRMAGQTYLPLPGSLTCHLRKSVSEL